jgi:hypothetical protein
MGHLQLQQTPFLGVHETGSRPEDHAHADLRAPLELAHEEWVSTTSGTSAPTLLGPDDLRSADPEERALATGFFTMEVLLGGRLPTHIICDGTQT